MSALSLLAASLGLSTEPQAPALSPTPATNDPNHQAPAPQATHTSEPKRTAWRVNRAGQPVGYIVGEPMSYAEALQAARWRWDDADIAKD